MNIDILLYLQELRETLGDFAVKFFKMFTDLGGSSLSIVICAVIFWCINKELGELIGMSLSTGALVSQALKNTFCVYRPWVREPRIAPPESVLKGATGYSFPSIHSQMGVNIYGTVAKNSKQLPVKILLSVLIALIGFSRCFLGVHTPLDVLAGLLVGTASVFVAPVFLSFLKKKKNNDIIFFIAGLAFLAVFLIYTTLKPYPVDTVGGEVLVKPSDMIYDCYRFAGTFSGFCAGYIIESRFINFEVCVRLDEKLARGAVGSAFMLALNKLLELASRYLPAYLYGFLMPFALMLFMLAAWPYLFKKIRIWCGRQKSGDAWKPAFKNLQSPREEHFCSHP